MLLSQLYEELNAAPRWILAIDGNCCAGKSKFAAQLAERFSATVFHMDDFFLRPEQRTAERLAAPGGNVDHERFRAEVLLPLTRGEDVQLRRLTAARSVCSMRASFPSIRASSSRAAIPCTRRCGSCTTGASCSRSIPPCSGSGCLHGKAHPARSVSCRSGCRSKPLIFPRSNRRTAPILCWIPPIGQKQRHPATERRHNAFIAPYSPPPAGCFCFPQKKPPQRKCAGAGRSIDSVCAINTPCGQHSSCAGSRAPCGNRASQGRSHRAP